MSDTLATRHGPLALPAFLPDATRAVVRTVDSADLETCVDPADRDGFRRLPGVLARRGVARAGVGVRRGVPLPVRPEGREETADAREMRGAAGGARIGRDDLPGRVHLGQGAAGRAAGER